jgi:hypothetical protein
MRPRSLLPNKVRTAQIIFYMCHLRQQFSSLFYLSYAKIINCSVNSNLKMAYCFVCLVRLFAFVLSANQCIMHCVCKLDTGGRTIELLIFVNELVCLRLSCAAS